MDEKWVMAVVSRCHIKIMETDYEARYHMAHHKNYLDQVMFIVINGFIPKDNDLLGNGVYVSKLVVFQLVIMRQQEKVLIKEFIMMMEVTNIQRLLKTLKEKKENCIGRIKLFVRQE